MKCVQKLFAGCLMMALVSAATQVHALKTVAKDGSGNFTTIQGALDVAAAGEEVRVIDKGNYAEGPQLNNVSLTSVPEGAIISGTTLAFNGTGAASLKGFTITPPGDAWGIAINAAGTIQIENVTISGGITGMNVLAAAQVTMLNGLIQDTGGHGVWVDNTDAAAGAKVTFDHTEITRCHDMGIAVLNNCTIKLINQSSIHHVLQSGIAFAVSGSAEDQGGYNLVIENSSIHDNEENGLMIQKLSDVTLRNATISNNPTRGINWDGQKVDGGTALIENCTFSGNQGTYGAGGAIWFGRNGNYTVRNSVFNDNEYGISRYWQGKTSTVDTHVTVEGCTFTANKTHGITFIAQAMDYFFEIHGNTFRDNGTEALFVFTENPGNQMVVHASKNILHDGSSRQSALAVYSQVDEGSSFVNNLVDQGMIGLALNAQGTLQVAHNTFVNALTAVQINDAGTNLVQIMNNIMDGVRTGVGSDAGAGLSQVNIDYNLIRASDANFGTEIAPQAGAHNLTGLAPSFKSPSASVGQGDYQLNADSPAINAGDTTLAVTEDLLGHKRPSPPGSKPDLGAYEDQGSTLNGVRHFELYL